MIMDIFQSHGSAFIGIWVFISINMEYQILQILEVDQCMTATIAIVSLSPETMTVSVLYFSFLELYSNIEIIYLGYYPTGFPRS